VGDLYPGRGIEHLDGDVHGGAGAGGAVAQRLLPRLGDQLGHGGDAELFVDDNERRHRAEQHHRLERSDRVVIHRGFQDRADHHGAETSQQDGLAVRIGAGDEFGGDGAARSTAIIDDDVVAEFLRQLARQDPRHLIDRAARRERHDDLDRLGQRRRWRACQRRRPARASEPTAQVSHDLLPGGGLERPLAGQLTASVCGSNGGLPRGRNDDHAVLLPCEISVVGRTRRPARLKKISKLTQTKTVSLGKKFDCARNEMSARHRALVSE
jgi:hypothetical protein